MLPPKMKNQEFYKVTSLCQLLHTDLPV